MPDIEPRIKKIYTYSMKNFKKKNPDLPTHPLNIWVGNCKRTIFKDGLIPLIRRCRNRHSLAYQVPIANSDIYKCSFFPSEFFPQTIRDWNALPDSLISSAEGAEDRVAKFTSLVRAGD